METQPPIEEQPVHNVERVEAVVDQPAATKKATKNVCIKFQFNLMLTEITRDDANDSLHCLIIVCYFY